MPNHVLNVVEFTGDEQSVKRLLESITEESMNNNIKKLENELRRARNELCHQCGCYKDAHRGACDGCHWKDEWREMIDTDEQ